MCKLCTHVHYKQWFICRLQVNTGTVVTSSAAAVASAARGATMTHVCRKNSINYLSSL